MKKKRDSGIELLRIICMILIIFHHYSYHGGFQFTVRDYGPAMIAIQEAAMFGRIACSVFVLITGYFLVTSECGNHYAKVLPLVMELCFYYAVTAFGVWLVQPYPFHWSETQKFFGTILSGNWFVVRYILFYLFVPFINPWLRSLTKKQFSWMIIMIYCIWSVEPTISIFSYLTPVPLKAWWFSETDFFVVMYLTGSYLRLHCDLTKHRGRWIGAFLGSTAFLVGSVAVMDNMSVRFPALPVSSALVFLDYNTIPAVIWAISAFVLFSNLHFYSPVINEIAACVLGVYILHDNDLIRPLLWKRISPNLRYVKNPFIHMPVKVFCVFAVCVAIEMLRRKCFGERLEAWMVKKLTKPETAE